MSDIVVLIPALGRPGNAQACMHSLRRASTHAHRAVFICNHDDTDQIRACEETGAEVWVVPWEAGHADFAKKINHAAARVTEEFVFQAADDVEFQKGWDVELLKVAEMTGAGVIGTNDLANGLVKRGGHSTHSLIRRSYILDPGASMDGPGTVFSEAYWHQCVDNELVSLARSRGQWAFAARSLVRHRHPIWRTADDDATYRKGNLHHKDDSRLFVQRERLWTADRRRP